MDSAPGERESQHFYDLALTATRNFRKLYVKWRPKFLEALASLIMSLHKHQDYFIRWIMGFVQQAIGDVITIHLGVTQAELEESLDDGVHFWQGLIEATKELSEPTCVQMYDAMINTILGYISSVVTDSINPTLLEKKVADKDLISSAKEDNSNIYLSRLADFLLLLLPNCQKQWFVRWYPNYVQLVQKLMVTNKNPKLYKLMAAALLAVDTKEIMSKHNQHSFDMVYKWIITVGVTKLNDFRSGLLEIGPDDRNKHVLLDFIEKLGAIIKGNLLSFPIDQSVKHEANKFVGPVAGTRDVEMAKKEIFNFLFSYLMQSKETLKQKNEEEKDELAPNIEIRKGRAIALKKLQAAKQRRAERQNEREELEVRVLGLLGRLGGISHQIVKDEANKESDETRPVSNFIEILTSKTSGFQFNANVEGFGIQIQMKSFLNRIIQLSEHVECEENTLA
jgi:hypothetical protein